ncbi:hypothetical protein J7K05_00445 [bacterium]|nr:hypothetical protein [bacterium]
MWDITPPKKENKEKATLSNKKRETSWRKAPATPDFKHFSWQTVIWAFFAALLIVLGIIFREKIKFKSLDINLNLPQPQPAEINLEVENKPQPLAYYAVQNKEKVEIKKLLDKDKEETIFSFNSSSLSDNTISLKSRYIAYIDNEGVKLYSQEQKQTDLILKATQLSTPLKVRLSDKEDFVAFSLITEKGSSISIYSLKERQTIETLTASDFIFGSKHLFLAAGQDLLSFDLDKKRAEKITQLNEPIIEFFKTQKGVYFVSGQNQEINIWQINKQNKAERLNSFRLALNFSEIDFGWAQKENTLYLSFAGEILELNLKTKEKKKSELDSTIYRLLAYLDNKKYFIGLKKPSALKEYSLVIFNKKDTVFESPIKEKILYLGS